MYIIQTIRQCEAFWCAWASCDVNHNICTALNLKVLDANIVVVFIL